MTPAARHLADPGGGATSRNQRGEGGPGCLLFLLASLVVAVILGYLYVSAQEDEFECRDTVSGKQVCE